MDADSLRALRLALGPGVDVQAVAECASTNTQLLELARQGLSRPVLLVAEAQTAGRGRMGRSWHSWPGASLTFSLAWPWDRSGLAGLAGLSLAVGCALAQALDPAGAHIRLKWPNDLLLGGAKLGGILIETVAHGASAHAVVIGVGLNLQSPSLLTQNVGQDIGQDIGQAAAGLQQLDARWTPTLALAAIAPSLVGLLQGWPQQGWAAWAEAFAKRDALHGQHLRAGAVLGQAEGVDDQGQLLLRLPTGGRHAVAAGEVSLRPEPSLQAEPKEVH